jgi:hypothetical protein
MTRTPLSLGLCAGALMTVLLLGACASERGVRVDDIVRIPLTARSATAPSAPAPDGAERIQREDALRRDLSMGRASDESRDRCSLNGWIEGC